MAEPSTAHAASFSQQRRARIKNLLVVFALAFICFLPLWGFVLFEPRFILYFPAGVIVLLSDMGLVPSVDGNEAGIRSVSMLIWLLLIGISALILASKWGTAVRMLFLALILLLMLCL